MKVLSVGDVHAKDWIIREVAEVVDFYDHIIFCGDYVDNWLTGPLENIVTWRALKELVDSNPKKIHALVGNHDYAYIQSSIAGQSSGWDHITYLKINDLENKDLREWLGFLPPVKFLDGVCYSHAGVTEQWDNHFTVQSLWNDASPIWARPPQSGGQFAYRNIPQVFGHTPQETCTEIGPNIWCIDTFSQTQNGSFIGDKTMLEVIDGVQFNKKEIKGIHDNNSTPDFEATVS